jgi:hypothetical protein
MTAEGTRIWTALCAADSEQEAESAEDRAQADEEKAEAERDEAEADRTREGRSKAAKLKEEVQVVVRERNGSYEVDKKSYRDLRNALKAGAEHAAMRWLSTTAIFSNIKGVECGPPSPKVVKDVLMELELRPDLPSIVDYNMGTDKYKLSKGGKRAGGRHNPGGMISSPTSWTGRPSRSQQQDLDEHWADQPRDSATGELLPELRDLPKKKAVVINRQFGGFGLSKRALAMFNAITGKKVAWADDIPRHHPALIYVVETLGRAANGSSAKLLVVPVSGGKYIINEYDGMENVRTPGSIDWISMSKFGAADLEEGQRIREALGFKDAAWPSEMVQVSMNLVKKHQDSSGTAGRGMAMSHEDDEEMEEDKTASEGQQIREALGFPKTALLMDFFSEWENTHTDGVRKLRQNYRKVLKNAEKAFKRGGWKLDLSKSFLDHYNHGSDGARMEGELVFEDLTDNIPRGKSETEDWLEANIGLSYNLKGRSYGRWTLDLTES